MSDSGNKIKFIGLAVCAFVLLFMLTGTILLWRGSQDLEEPDDRDLAIVEVEVAEADNALTYVKKAIAAAVWDRAAVDEEDPNAVDLKHWLKGEEKIEAKVLAKTIAENRASFEWLKRAVEFRRFYSPMVSILDDHRSWSFSEFMQLRHLWLSKARWEFEAGAQADAADTLITLHRLGELIQSEATSLIGLLFGHALILDVDKEMIRLARQPETSLATVQQMSAELSKDLDFNDIFSRALKGEYRAIAMTIDQIDSSDAGRERFVAMTDMIGNGEGLDFLKGSFLTYRFHPNRTKHLTAQRCRQSLQALSLSYLDTRSSGLFEDLDLEEDWTALLKPNSLGNILAYHGFVGPYIVDRKHRIVYDNRSAHAALAVLAYRKEHGNFPASLGELVGNGLKAIPMDPFDSKPMRYNPTKLIIYTVGEDGIDDPDDRKAWRIELQDWDKAMTETQEAAAE